MTPQAPLTVADHAAASMFPAFDRRSSVYICSISPVAHSKEQRHVSVGDDGKIRMITNYYIPPVEKGQYYVLEVKDTAQMIQNTLGGPGGYELQPAPITALQAAESLLSNWTATVGTSDGGSLGLMLIQGPVPTEEELKKLNDKQENFFRFLIREGDSWHRRGDHKRITDLHLKAVEWMGVKRDWATRIVKEELKSCIACGAEIKYNARKCKECDERLVDFAITEDMSQEDLEEQDPFIARLVVAKRNKKPKKAGRKSAQVDLFENEESQEV